MAQEYSLSPACQNYEADLVLLHYGDLAASDKARVAQHAAQCAGCAGYLKELGKLMPLTALSDQPPQSFWMDYTRELRGKLDGAAEQKAWWQNLGAFLTPRYLAAYASAAVVVLALSLTLGKGIFSGKHQLQDDELAELLPVAENLDFFSAMDILDDFEAIELIGNQGNNAA
jgi:anti-sigma factor RsiW